MWAVIESPVGDFRLVERDDHLTAIQWRPFRPELPDEDEDPQHPVLAACATQLAEYFAGERQEFDLPLAPVGTEFQRQVWGELAKIKFGTTRTYGEVAKRLGMTPGFSRAVGSANGSNPIAIIVPCHRVIGANGKLTGFAGGIENKKLLLDLETNGLF